MECVRLSGKEDESLMCRMHSFLSCPLAAILIQLSINFYGQVDPKLDTSKNLQLDDTEHQIRAIQSLRSVLQI